MLSIANIISIYFSDSSAWGREKAGKQRELMRGSLFIGLGLLAACSAAPPTGSHTDGTIMCTGTAANEYRVDLVASGFAEFKGKTLHAVTDIQLARSPGA